MRKGFTPVVAVTLLLLTIIVVLGVINFWLVQIQEKELEREKFEVELNCSDTITIENYGFPTHLGPVIIRSGGDEFRDERPIKEIVIHCK